jgi:hypothetical protein
MSAKIESNVVAVEVLEAEVESAFYPDAAEGSDPHAATERAGGRGELAGDDAYVADWVI